MSFFLKEEKIYRLIFNFNFAEIYTGTLIIIIVIQLHCRSKVFELTP